MLWCTKGVRNGGDNVFTAEDGGASWGCIRYFLFRSHSEEI